MKEAIEYCTVLRGEAAQRFNAYLEAPSQTFSPEALAIFKRARERSEKRKTD